MSLSQELNELEQVIPYAECIDLSVSQESVGWQVDHTLKVIISVCSALKRSDEEQYKYSFNLSRLFVFTTGFIPRGRAKAPKIVVARRQVTEQALYMQLEQAKELWQDINRLPAKKHFNHQIFGLLDVKATKKFLKIHTRHHIKIINDIMKHEKSNL